MYISVAVCIHEELLMVFMPSPNVRKRIGLSAFCVAFGF